MAIKIRIKIGTPNTAKSGWTEYQTFENSWRISRRIGQRRDHFSVSIYQTGGSLINFCGLDLVVEKASDAAVTYFQGFITSQIVTDRGLDRVNQLTVSDYTGLADRSTQRKTYDIAA